jgi:hypothetical protein
VGPGASRGPGADAHLRHGGDGPVVDGGLERGYVGDGPDRSLHGHGTARHYSQHKTLSDQGPDRVKVDFYIKRHDTRPPLVKNLLDADGDPVNLSTASVVFIMSAGGVPKVNRAPVTVTNAPTGEVSYQWQAADTDTSGQYDGEFEVASGGGGVQTFPNPKKLVILVSDDLG